MKRFIFAVIALLSLFCTSELNAQNQILRLKNGKIEIRKENGVLVRNIGNGHAVEAYFNSDQSQVLITLDNGKVEVRKANGVLIRTLSLKNAVDARWHGDNEILVYYANGKIERRKLNGVLIRVL